MSEFRIFHYDPEPETPEWALKEGVTKGWLVCRDGDSARTVKAVALTDSEGVTSFEQDGEWQDATITHESPAQPEG